MSNSPRSRETVTPEDYRTALEEEELEKLTQGLTGLRVSNEKPLMRTYSVQPTTSRPGATQATSTQGKTRRGKSAKAHNVNIQAATRKLAAEHRKSKKESQMAKRRNASAAAVDSVPKAESLPNVLPAIPEGTRRTRAQTRKALETRVPIAQKKGVKTFKKKVALTYEQLMRQRRQARITAKRFGLNKETQAQKKAERSRKAKEAAAKAAASRAAKEEKKKAAIEKAKATKASKKDTEME